MNLKKLISANLMDMHEYNIKEILHNEQIAINRIIYIDDNNFKIFGIYFPYNDISYSTYYSALSIQVANGKILQSSCNTSSCYFNSKRKGCAHTLALLFLFNSNYEYYKSSMIKVNSSSELVYERLNEDIFSQRLIKSMASDLTTIEEDNVTDKLLENLTTIYDVTTLKEPVILRPVISNVIGNDGSLTVNYEIGYGKTFYKISNLPEFKKAIENNLIMKHGAKLKFKHDLSCFDSSYIEVLNYIINQANTINYLQSYSISKYNSCSVPKSKLQLNSSSINTFFNTFKDKNIKYEKNIYLCDLKPQEIFFKLSKQDNELYTLKLYNPNNINFCFTHGTIYFFNNDTNNIGLSKLNETKSYLIGKLLTNTMTFSKDTLDMFLKNCYPYIKENLILDMEDNNIANVLPDELGVKAYLDLDKDSNITCKINYEYNNDLSFNPLENVPSINYNRNLIEEERVMNHIKMAGFVKTNDVFTLSSEDDIYNFLVSRS